MFNDMDNLVNSFFKQSDEFIQKRKDHTFDMNEEEKAKYEEVGRKMDNLTKELESDLAELKAHTRYENDEKSQYQIMGD